MAKITIKIGTEEDFFQRGRQVARAADRAEPLPNALKEKLPAPPPGYPSWLDYAVECMDTRTAYLELELCATDGQEAPSRDSMRAAVRHELQDLRQRAGEPDKAR